MRRRRRLIGAAIAAVPVAVGLSLISASLNFADVLPSSCASPLLGVIACTPGSTPSVPGTSASPSASNGSSGGSTGAPSSSAGPTLTTTPSATPTPAAIPGTIVVADPLLAAELQAVLQNPVSAQQPDLLHFQPASSASTAQPGSPAPGAGRGDGVAATVLPVAGVGFAVVVAAAFSLMARRQRAYRLRWRSAGIFVLPMLAALPVAGAAAAVIAAQAPSAVQAPAPAASAAVSQLSMLGAQRIRATELPPLTVSHQWSALVGIETVINSEHTQLVNDEQQIKALTLEVNAETSAPELRHSLRPGQSATLTAVLARLVADHQEQLAAYNASLQQEYSFFVATVQSPQAATALQTVASHTPPEVQNAVSTDINLVQTQLQQEQQIESATASDQELPQLLNGTSLTFHAPLSGVVTQGFGATTFTMEPPVTYNGIFYPHFHTGLDIAAPFDAPVGAAAAGTVILATSSVDSSGNLVGYGNYVLISHGDGFLTLYGHLDKILVAAGQKVQQGEVIGLEGSTGWSTGAHLHFEIRKNGVYVDPAPYLASQLKPRSS
ncbi:MAG: M23 family metallopeptidase [Candidatus Dormibacteraeota bacterium]|nr:M23 family metallopeptidase [Candidatus Dormibacteraeota bacterium]